MPFSLRQNKKGFTLVELIVAMVIVAVMASLVVPGAVQYVRHSRQSIRMGTARTLFMAAQNAVTHLHNSGQLSAHPFSGYVDIEQITPALPGDETEANGANIRFLSLRRDEADRSENPLFTLIYSYIADKQVLDGSIVLEYNYKTGQVLSAFYSEEADYLAYDSGPLALYRRDGEALSSARVGYYGVNGTGFARESTGIDPVEIRLADYQGQSAGFDINSGMNYGLLSAECLLPQNAAGNLRYEITLTPQLGQAETLSFHSGAAGPAGSIALSSLPGSLSAAMAAPINVPAPGGDYTRRVVAYLETQPGGRELLVVVLDCPDAALGIAQNYKAIQPGYLSASLRAYSAADSRSAYSNRVHAYFADEAPAGDDWKYFVRSPRHLNNLRHRSSADFVQDSDIRMVNYAGATLNFLPIGGEMGFSGSYTAVTDAAWAIENLTVNGQERAALFDTIAAQGQVQGVTLRYTQAYENAYDAADDQSAYYLNGSALSAGIAAENLGSIADCSVLGRISGGKVGGIAALNAPGASIVRCWVGAELTAATTAGGIAGENRGVIALCETGTASQRDVAHARGWLNGTPYFGANASRILGGDQPWYYSPYIHNDAYYLSVSGAHGRAGGIAGENFAGGSISQCVNAMRVQAARGNAGGIAGYLHSAATVALSASYNAGSVIGGETAGGIAGYSNGRIASAYNTGHVNNTAVQDNRFGAGLWVIGDHLHTGSYAGGIAGQLGGNARVSHCYSMGYCGDAYGGGFGRSAANTAYVQGNYFVANMHNRSQQLRDADGTPQDSTLALMCSPGEMHAMAITGLRTSPGNESGVGAYDYPYPHIDLPTANGALGSAFHRTPWPQVVHETARIVQGVLHPVDMPDGSAYTNDVELQFCLNANLPGADVVFDSELGRVVVRIDKATRDWLDTHAYNPGDTPRVAMLSAGLGAQTLQLPAQVLRLGSDDPLYRLGYRYRYSVRLGWPIQDEWGSIPDQGTVHPALLAQELTPALYPLGSGDDAQAAPFGVGGTLRRAVAGFTITYVDTATGQPIPGVAQVQADALQGSFVYLADYSGISIPGYHFDRGDTDKKAWRIGATGNHFILYMTQD